MELLGISLSYGKHNNLIISYGIQINQSIYLECFLILFC